MIKSPKKLNITELTGEFQTATGCSPGQAQRWIGKYINLTVAELIRHGNKETRDRLAAPDHAEYRAHAVISANSINRGLGHILINGQRRQILPIINNLKSRLWTILTGDLGNNTQGRLSMATLHYNYEDIVMASGDQQELYKLVYAEHRAAIVAGDYDEVKIDLMSLDKFIQANRARPRRSDAESRRLDQNLRDAVRIKLLAEANDGQLIQVRKPSPFGREYYVGPNLQSVSKIVRLAALGKCHEVDLKSAVFGWRYGEFLRICEEQDPELLEDREKLPMPYTREYLANRDRVRRDLSRRVFGDDSEFHVKLIKSAMTALGFGAKLRGGGAFKSTDGRWTVAAIADVIRNTDARDKFITDEWVVKFVDEQDKITDAIVVEYQGSIRIEYFKSCPAADDLFDSQGRLKTNSLLSWLYQHRETQIRHRMLQELTSRDKEPLLSVHDCIYTRYKPDVGDLTYLINNEFGKRKYLNVYLIEHNEHKTYTFEDRGPGSEIYEHARLTQEDENLAASLAGKTPQDMMSTILNRDKNLSGAVYESAIDYNRRVHDGSGYNQPRWQPDWDLDDDGNEIVDQPIIIVGPQRPPAQGAQGQQ